MCIHVYMCMGIQSWCRESSISLHFTHWGHDHSLNSKFANSGCLAILLFPEFLCLHPLSSGIPGDCHARLAFLWDLENWTQFATLCLERALPAEPSLQLTEYTRDVSFIHSFVHGYLDWFHSLDHGDELYKNRDGHLFLWCVDVESFGGVIRSSLSPTQAHKIS